MRTIGFLFALFLMAATLARSVSAETPPPTPAPRLLGYALRLDEAVRNSDVIAVAFLIHAGGPILGPPGHGIYPDMRFKIGKLLKGHRGVIATGSALINADGTEDIPRDGAAYIIFAATEPGAQIRVLKFDSSWISVWKKVRFAEM